MTNPYNLPNTDPAPETGASVPSDPVPGAEGPSTSQTEPDVPQTETPQTETPQPDAQEGGASQVENPTEKPAKPAGLMHAGEEPADDQGQTVLGAPEGDYEFQAPEGTELDQGLVKDFGEVARELNLSQDAAQKLVAKMSPSLERMQAEKIEHLRAEWAAASRNDAEFGGDQFDTNMKGVNRAYSQFTTPELREIFARTGLDSHPEMIRMFHRLAKQTRDPRYVRGAGSTETDAGDLRKFYKGMEP